MSWVKDTIMIKFANFLKEKLTRKEKVNLFFV